MTTAKHRRQPVRPAGRGLARLPSRFVPAIIGVVVVGVAVLIGVLSTGEQSDRVTVDDIAGEVTVEGERFARFGGAVDTDPVIGRPAPIVRGADFDGTPTTIGGDRAPQIIAFMASWCPACQQELPVLVDWIDAGGVPDDVELLIVATGLDDRRPNWPPDRWLEQEGYRGPVLVDDAAGSVAGAFGLSATPFWVVLDARGDVAVRFAGMLSQADFDQLVALARA